MKGQNVILVVGGAGYIGTHVVKELLDCGREVVILDNLCTGNSDLIPGGELVEGDIGNETLLNDIFNSYSISTVMHFAAFSVIGESVAFPLKYYENNVTKTISLLKIMLQHRVKRFIFSSSAAVYGEPEKIPITEQCATRPTNPYGCTKLIIENILKDCDESSGLHFMSLRYFNAAGAHKSGMLGEAHRPESHLIPQVLMAAQGDKDAITIFGTDYPTPDGTCIRDYIHVTDLAQGHILALDALENGEPSGVYNLGNDRGYSVREVIRTAEKVSGSRIPVVEGPRRPSDATFLVASSEKIKKELGWKPELQDLDTIVKTAWAWHSREIFRPAERLAIV